MLFFFKKLTINREPPLVKRTQKKENRKKSKNAKNAKNCHQKNYPCESRKKNRIFLGAKNDELKTQGVKTRC
jgi:hypothetical protein